MRRVGGARCAPGVWLPAPACAHALWLGCLLLAPMVATSAPAGEQERDLRALLAGEYNNHEQVWQQREDEQPESQRWHIGLMPADDDTFVWWFEEGQGRYASGKGRQLPTQRWTLDVLAVGDVGDSAADLASVVREASSGSVLCTYGWHTRETGYAAEVSGVACPLPLPDRWQITREGLRAEWDDQQMPLIARRVRDYRGWIVLKRQHIDPQADADAVIFLPGLQVHDQSTVVPVLDEGEPTGYAVELAQLTYQETRVAVLKLGIIDEASGETLAYSWASPGAGRVGINLRWIQAGFTRVDSAPGGSSYSTSTDAPTISTKRTTHSKPPTSVSRTD